MTSRDRHLQFAAELAEAAMVLARDVAQAALAAQAVADKVALTQAHERLARSVRLSIQLHEALERAAAEAAEPVLAALERRHAPQLELRKAQVRAAVRRSIEQDYEGEDAALLEAALDAELAEHALTLRFMNRPPIETAAILRKALRLPEDLCIRLPEAAGSGRAGPS